jgi:AraC-like DNA-binding protein
MKMEVHQPAPVLKPYIKTFMLIESEYGMQNRTLPDTSIVMGFRYRGTITDEILGAKSNLPASLITGLRRSWRLINYSGQAATLLVVFKPGGAAAFFKEPLHELFGSSLALDALISPGKLQEVEDQLAEAKNSLQRIAIIERFLLSRLGETRPDKLVHQAINQIQLSNGAIKIKDLVNSLPISNDPFEKRFRRLTGTSAKQFSSIVRLRHVINSHTPSKSLTETALAAGYFDQAHFIKDFKLFTGQTPLNFFKAPRFW